MLMVLRFTLLDVLVVVVALVQLAPLLVFSTELVPTIRTPTTRIVAHSISRTLLLLLL
jgi:hypothetical protein